jgi:hypothetical protein
MKIEDIKVGKKYHDALTGNTLLGIGMRKLFTEDEYREKHLVVIDSDDPDCIGKMIQEGEDAAEGYWDYIDEYDETGNIRILICK